MYKPKNEHLKSSISNSESNWKSLLSHRRAHTGQYRAIASRRLSLHTHAHASQTSSRTISSQNMMLAMLEFALTPAALLCRERLLPHTTDDSAQPIGGSYLAVFDAIWKGQDISNRRMVFELIILSLVRVLLTLDTSEETVRLLAEDFDKEISLLGRLDGVSDQYCAKKIRGYDHNSAFEEVREGHFSSVKTGTELLVPTRWLYRDCLCSWLALYECLGVPLYE